MKINLNDIYNKCIKYSESIKNPILKELIKVIYKDYKEKLINKPATTESHHCFKGGLLYHIYSVTRNAIAICNLYPNLEVDMDLVIFGSLLHNIGKCNVFKDFNNDDDDLVNGNSSALLGHSYEGRILLKII